MPNPIRSECGNDSERKPSGELIYFGKSTVSGENFELSARLLSAVELDIRWQAVFLGSSIFVLGRQAVILLMSPTHLVLTMALPNLIHRINQLTCLPLAIILLLCFGLPTLHAQTRASRASKSMEAPANQPVETTADSMDFDQATHTVTARGNVVCTYGKIKLYADKAQINTETKQAHAEGHVRLRQGYQEWNAEALDYNFDTGAIKAGHARAQLDDNVFVEGASMEGADKKR